MTRLDENALLRSQLAELEVSLQALKEENAMLRDDVRTERVAVVAWLRANREASTLPKTCWEADAIERGEHRREEEP